MDVEFLWYMPLTYIFGAFLLLLAVGGARQLVLLVALRRELAAAGDAGRSHLILQKLDAVFREAFNKRRKQVTVPPYLTRYAGAVEQIDAVAARYHYDRTEQKGKSSKYAIVLPPVEAIQPGPAAHAARATVHARYGVDPFDEHARATNLAQARRIQRIINWTVALLLIPAILCFSIAVVAFGGGKSHDPGDPLIADQAPTFATTMAILTPVFAVPAIILIVAQNRRRKHYRNLADGPREALGWELLGTAR